MQPVARAKDVLLTRRRAPIQGPFKSATTDTRVIRRGVRSDPKSADGGGNATRSSFDDGRMAEAMDMRDLSRHCESQKACS